MERLNNSNQAASYSEAVIDWVSIGIGGVIGLAVGIASSAAIYALTRPRRALRMTQITTPIVSEWGESWPGLQLLYNKEEIPSVAASVVVVWNDGNLPLKTGDLMPGNPPRIEFAPSADALAVTELSIGRGSSGLHVPQTPHLTSYPVTFDVLEPRHGLAIQFIHTGTSLDVMKPGGHLVGGGDMAYGDPWNRLVAVGSLFIGMVLTLALISLFPAGSVRGWLAILPFLPFFVGAALFFLMIFERGKGLQARTDRSLIDFLPPLSESQTKLGRILRGSGSERKIPVKTASPADSKRHPGQS